MAGSSRQPGRFAWGWAAELDAMIRPMKKSDVPAVVRAWNEHLVFDTVDAKEFKKIVLDDPNYDPNGTVVAIGRGGVVGFACCVAREGPAGADGRGTEEHKDDGYLKGIFYHDDTTGKALLERVESLLRGKARSLLRVVEYGGGRYFFPGIDPRYKGLLGFLKRHGFAATRRLQDVSLDLEAHPPGQGEYQRKQWDRLREAGVRIVCYRGQMLTRMRVFVQRFNTPNWFGRDWERHWQSIEHAVVAVRGDEVLGFACYYLPRAGSAVGHFGPIGTLKPERGQGIGSCMLDECMRRSRQAGARTVIAYWANVPFYLANGWEVCREYCVLQKRI